MKANILLKSLVALALTALPQMVGAQSTNNDDGVVKFDTHHRYNASRPGEVLVKFKDESPIKVQRVAGRYRAVSAQRVNSVLKQFGTVDVEPIFKENASGAPRKLRRSRSYTGKEVAEVDLSQIYRIRIQSQQSDSAEQMIAQLEKLPEVEYAEPNYLVYALDAMPAQGETTQVAPQAEANADEPAGDASGKVICADPTASPLYSQQWGIKAMGIDQLWTKPIVDSTQQVIAILDTGVDITHPNLKDNIWTNTVEAEGEAGYDDDGDGFVDDVHGWDFINNTPNIRDFNMHGTHVAGIAAAANNGLGIVGANPLAKIMPVTVMQSDGTGDIATLARGVEYAADKGATVINMSLGTYADSKVLKNALARAYQTCVLVGAAGNDGNGIYPSCGATNKADETGSTSMYPAAYSFVLGVQATTQKGGLAEFSNFDCDGPTYSEIGWDGVNYELSAPGVGILSTIPNGTYKHLSGTSMSAPLVAGAVSALRMVKKYENQETLWGDLIHSADFAAAYDVTERPADLDLLSMEVRDTLSGCDEDGLVDAGETVAFYPTLRTTWGDAKNIKISLNPMDADDPDASLYEILTKEVDFTYNLSVYAQAKSPNPIIVKFKEGIPDRRTIHFNFQAIADNMPQPLSVVYDVRVYNVVKLQGMITKDMTLTADKNYRVVKDVAIPQGVTLKIEPGTRVVFDANTGISAQGKIDAHGEPGRLIEFTCDNGFWSGINTDYGISYCIYEYSNGSFYPCLTNCIVRNCHGQNDRHGYVRHNKTVFVDNTYTSVDNPSPNNYTYSNFINNVIRRGSMSNWIEYRNKLYSNIFNLTTGSAGINSGVPILLGVSTTVPRAINVDSLVYLGSGKEENIRPQLYELGNNLDWASTFAYHDLTNLRKTPIREAHGIVWKVVVDGYDAQDEYDELPPLGVGKHKFEVYFSRPMNVAKAPMVAFGVRSPYTQNGVSEEGSWSADSTVYTVYKTITGKTSSDGVNTIYVNDAEDDEYFPCPREDVRFHINIQAAGSLSTGFMGEGGLGRVNLTWDNTENNFDDFLGYNLYRYTMVNDSTKGEAQRINDFTLDNATTAYTDYDVTPGQTYYYYYKVISTDLKETDPSNIVAVTPQTATLGDANGSGAVDVADVVTVVNYSIGQNPKPFIFEAADMNADKSIDILDIIGIIKTIVHPNDKAAEAGVESIATYSIEGNTLYVESPVELAGVQVSVQMANQQDATVADDLKGFETTSAWTSASDYLFLAYSMTGKTLPAGKHALLHFGTEAQVAGMTLSDKYGHNVPAIANGTTGLTIATKETTDQPYPSPFSNKLTIPYTIAEEGTHQVCITLTDLTGRIVMQMNKRIAHAGKFAQTWTGGNALVPGVYLVKVSIDGETVTTAKVMHQ